MLTQLSKWDQSKVYWFVKLQINAVASDRKITLVEMQRMLQVFNFVKVASQKEELILMLRQSENPVGSIEVPPEDLTQSELAGCFLDTAKLLISDFDFEAQEYAFLLQIAEMFNFESDFTKHLLNWCDEGFFWKQKQTHLLRKKAEEIGFTTESQLNLHSLDSGQKAWYAEIIIRGFLIDGKLDSEERAILIHLIKFVDKEAERKRILDIAKSVNRPMLPRPVGLNIHQLKIIYLEIINHFVFNTASGDVEYNFAHQIAQLSKLPSDFVFEAELWWRDGVAWHNKVHQLL
ncbi:MAG: hypothetical protein QNL04_09420 [SAR324 cluster bacterium]|nr:hypothetical protein [SAR324 cluster bacterium]